MAPGRRGRPPGGSSSSSTNNPRAAAGQGTLAFGGRNNKITKPSLPPPPSSHNNKKPSSKLSSSSSEQQQQQKQRQVKGLTARDGAKEGEEEEEGDEGTVKNRDLLAVGVSREEEVNEKKEKAIAIRETMSKKEEEEGIIVDPLEEKAKKVPDSAVKRYWREKEAERKAPRVHQTTLSLHEKILRHFDLSSQFGPCVGIPRVRRWKRAEGLGLRPPIEVLAVLVKGDEEYGHGRGRGDGDGKDRQRAFMDGLLGGSAVVG
ncbi:MAG: hypothetical protein Q9216_002148 [Gyalolechia sp. 2 TL-2023]